MIAPLSRILARYLSGALVAYGLLTAPEAAQLEPDLVLLIGVGLGALTEGAYVLARRFGWAT